MRWYAGTQGGEGGVRGEDKRRKKRRPGRAVFPSCNCRPFHCSARRPPGIGTVADKRRPPARRAQEDERPDDLLEAFCFGRAITTGRKNPRRANGSARDKARARIKARGDVCAICGKPIDYTLGMITDPATGRTRPHPMSFAVDELIPVSRGGDPYDASPGGNCRAAHWICNSRRGDGTRRKGPTTLALPQPWDT